MKQIFEIKDRSIINELLDSTEYGTLAVSYNDEPYAVPVNFVRIDDDIYFHGALSNKKMKILALNPKVSFSVVQNYSLIASFFSSTEGLACPATQFFKSVSIDGVTKLVESREEKALVFEALMKKLQPEGGYKPFSDAEYDTAIKATAVIKIVPSSLRCKFKFGQHVTKERFDMILAHLEKRDTEIDKETVKMMKQLRVEIDE
jgi:nitroimidazol reductase NimA-like FMN-containing flavoprotein (pyridoxamine 5'-phosphate oxidase superfamily)